MNLAAGSVFNPSYAFLNADGVSVVLSFLNKYAEAKVLSTPRTVTLDNEMASIMVVRASPIIQITPVPCRWPVGRRSPTRTWV